MSFPIRTTVEDVQAVCGYLAKKPTGATVKEAKAVLDSRKLDGRKLTAMKFWGLIENQERLKLTHIGREAVRDEGSNQATVLAEVIKNVAPYNAIIERAGHSDLESITALDVAAHWHDHFSEEVSTHEKTLNDQAICFFQLASGAALGSLVVGRKGSPTRFEFDRSATAAFVEGELPTYTKPDAPEDEHQEGDDDQAQSGSTSQPPSVKAQSQLGEGIFVAHGKNKKPLEQLKRILDQFKIPYKVAIEEPNLGRPIGSKIRETMEACNCAILIFTADEEFQDLEGNTIWRPSENIVYELGAAGFLYDKRIVILKEEGVQLASNFNELGYIPFSRDQLESRSMEVLKELIGFGIVKISV